MVYSGGIGILIFVVDVDGSTREDALDTKAMILL